MKKLTWSAIPEAEQSKFPSATRSFNASTIFLRREALSMRASNIFEKDVFSVFRTKRKAKTKKKRAVATRPFVGPICNRHQTWQIFVDRFLDTQKLKIQLLLTSNIFSLSSSNFVFGSFFLLLHHSCLVLQKHPVFGGESNTSFHNIFNTVPLFKQCVNHRGATRNKGRL